MGPATDDCWDSIAGRRTDAGRGPMDNSASPSEGSRIPRRRGEGEGLRERAHGPCGGVEAGGGIDRGDAGEPGVEPGGRATPRRAVAVGSRGRPDRAAHGHVGEGKEVASPRLLPPVSRAHEEGVGDHAERIEVGGGREVGPPGRTARAPCRAACRRSASPPRRVLAISAMTLATPKSSTLIRGGLLPSCSVRKRFCGLRSRWMMKARCVLSSASAVWCR